MSFFYFSYLFTCKASDTQNTYQLAIMKVQHSRYLFPNINFWMYPKIFPGYQYNKWILFTPIVFLTLYIAFVGNLLIYSETALGDGTLYDHNLKIYAVLYPS